MREMNLVVFGMLLLLSIGVALTIEMAKDWNEEPELSEQAKQTSDKAERLIEKREFMVNAMKLKRKGYVITYPYGQVCADRTGVLLGRLGSVFSVCGG